MQIPRLVLTGLVSLLLMACAESDVPPEASTPSTSEAPPAQTQEDEPQAADAEPSAFLADGLHDMQMPPAGTFRLEVAGEVFEGQVEESCGWMMRSADGANQDRFSAYSWHWRTEDGRRMAVEMRRFVMYDDFFWNLSHGHEVDQVTLQLRAVEGGSLAQIEETAWSRMHLLRVSAGADPMARMGGGDLPAIRVSDDGRQATASGELQAPDYGEPEQFGDPLTGPFTLAVHCPE